MGRAGDHRLDRFGGQAPLRALRAAGLAGLEGTDERLPESLPHRIVHLSRDVRDPDAERAFLPLDLAQLAAPAQLLERDDALDEELLPAGTDLNPANRLRTSSLQCAVLMSCLP
jgi:hypothetical protein